MPVGPGDLRGLAHVQADQLPQVEARGDEFPLGLVGGQAAHVDGPVPGDPPADDHVPPFELAGLLDQALVAAEVQLVHLGPAREQPDDPDGEAPADVSVRPGVVGHLAAQLPLELHGGHGRPAHLRGPGRRGEQQPQSGHDRHGHLPHNRRTRRKYHPRKHLKANATDLCRVSCREYTVRTPTTTPTTSPTTTRGADPWADEPRCVTGGRAAPGSTRRGRCTGAATTVRCAASSTPSPPAPTTSPTAPPTRPPAG